MPDKADAPAYDQCTSCAFASQKGQVNEPLPTSHTDVCCLYKFHRHGQGEPLCLKEEGSNGTITCDGLCKQCPQNGGESAAVPRKGTGSKIAPRRRRGFKKLTIELRPPKFKKKLWFGTYEPEDVDRATDAINYYMGRGEPYILADSPLLFAQYKLGIEYRELRQSCEQFVQVGEKQMRESAYFARRVKEVIKTVTGKKKGQQRRQKKGAKKETTPEPVMSCTSGLTSASVDMVCQETSNVAAAASEANSELATNFEMLTCQAEVPADDEFNWDMDTFPQLSEWWDPFLSSESSPAVDGMMEDNGFSFPSY